MSWPLLHFVEINTQEVLLNTLSQLYEDLENDKVNSLNEYKINYQHVRVSMLTSMSAGNILHNMCLEAAQVVNSKVDRDWV